MKRKTLNVTEDVYSKLELLKEFYNAKTYESMLNELVDEKMKNENLQAYCEFRLELKKKLEEKREELKKENKK